MRDMGSALADRARRLLIAGAHMSPCAFSDLAEFTHSVMGEVQLVGRLSDDDIIDEFHRVQLSLIDCDPRADSASRRILLGEDLARVELALREADGIGSILDLDLNRLKDTILQHMSALGLKTRYDPVVRVVDSFPPPYDKADWSAMAPDEDDWREYGIEPGIYFLRAKAHPFFAQATLAHEMLHCVPKIMSGSFPMGLEEAICDLIGFIHIGSALMGRDEVSRAFVYYRLLPNVSRLRSMYVDHDRLALSLLAAKGIGGLCDLLSQGRLALRTFEVECLLPDSYLTARMQDQESTELLSLSDWLLNRYLPRQCLPPLAFRALPFIEPGASVTAIAERLQCNSKLLAQSLKSAAVDSQLFMMSDELHVGYSNVELYLKVQSQMVAPTIRYEV